MRTITPFGVLLFILLHIPVGLSAQTAEREEIAVSFEVPKVITKDIFVRYDGTTMYLPAGEILRLLEINNVFDPISGRFQGFFINRDSAFVLDPHAFKATVKSRELPLLASDCFIDGNEIYLKLEMFNILFGLEMKFDFSLLRVFLPLNESFPSYQKIKRQQARDKLRKTEVSLRNLKIVPQKRDYFSGGVADWLISANPVGGGGHYFDLTLGAMVAGGDFSFSGTGNSVTGIPSDQLAYKWHYTFNPNKYVTQAELGTVFSSGPLARGMKGVLVTNRPLIQRTHFQTIHLTGRLEEGWEAELFIDNRLVDFATSDQSGEYNFPVEIIYGTSVIHVKLYGPNGEIRTEEHQIRIPYTLIPKNTTEYSFAAGSVAMPTGRQTHIQSSAYYGLFDRLTVGAGVDIPATSENKEQLLYAGEISYQVINNVTANGVVSPNNKAEFNTTYTLPSFASIGFNFTRFYGNPYQSALRQIHNATFSFAAPFRIKGRYIGARFYIARDKYPTFNTTSMNYGLNGAIWRLHMNYLGKFKITTYPDRTIKSLASQILMSADIFRWLRPQFRVDIDHEFGNINRLGIYVNRRFLKTGQLTLSYERNPIAKSNSIMLTINIFNQAAYFTSRILYSDRQFSMNQMQRGSVRYDRIGEKIRFDRRNSVGYGSAVVRPFLDINNDGVANKGETYLPGLRAKINGVGGRTLGAKKLFYYDGLRPYDEYLVQIDQASLDDPTLKPAYDNFKVSVNPNVVTTIDVPVVPASDISGRVERTTIQGSYPVGGIKIKILNISRDVITEVVTFNNGEFYFLGLIPGLYRTYIDPEQLTQYGFKSEPESIEFEIKPSDKSTSIENINFSLSPK